MTNNNFEDFEHTDGEHGETHETMAPPPTGLRANLSGAWRSQPLFKLFVLMVVVGAVVAVAVSLFSGSTSKSSVGLAHPPDLHEAPGGKSTPYLKEQTELANKQRTEEAMQNGSSALPTPIGPGIENSELNNNAAKEDPLNELRAEVDNQNKQLQEMKQAQAAPPAAQQAPEQFDDTLAQAMQRQMGQMLESWVPKGNRLVAVYDMDTLLRERQAATEKGDQANGGTIVTSSGATTTKTAADAAAAAPPAKTIVPAGTVSYAQLLTEANSDVPGAILAQIVSGPLKGARAVGKFEVANGYSDYLTLTFKLADLKGTDYHINALALDPDTTLGGMATEVDQRYITRLVLPAAAGFLQGFASAIGQGDTSITTNGTTTIVDQSSKGTRQGVYTGISAAAQTASQFFQTQANLTKPLVRVASGTPMGLFFIDTVTDAPWQQQQRQDNNLINANGQFGYGQNAYGQNGQAGQMGYGQNGYGATNGAYSSTGGYPVLYPSATMAPTNNNVGGFGVMPQTNTSYPGSTVYYTH